MKAEYPFYDIRYEMETVKDVIETTQIAYGNNPVFRYKENKQLIERSKEEFIRDVRLVGDMFHDRFPKGSHIAVIGKTSYEWLVAYFGAMCSENIALPLDKELPQDDLMELMKMADVDVLVYDPAYESLAKRVAEDMQTETICMKELLMANKKAAADLWIGNPEKDDVAEIVFTSGTTGVSKGCMITHGNLAANAMNGTTYVVVTKEETTMSILPINHALEITAGIMAPMCLGVTICINESLKYLNRNLKFYKPQCMIVVPLVIETLHKTIWKEINKTGKRRRIKCAMMIVRGLYQCGIDVRRKVFAQLLEPLGGNLRLLICGGAYMEPGLIKDFETWGINIVQGYGITECAPVVSCNTDRCKKYASVGKIVTGCQVKIVENEIWVKGPIVMKGYYKNEEATQQAFEGEWFKTGDLGRFDSDNWLYITGRKKNLIILPNGENVSPEELEQKILKIPYVKEVVVSENDVQIQAEVYLDQEELQAEASFQNEIAEMNRHLPNYKKITKIVFREKEFEKTTTRKIKRKEGT